MEEFAILNAQIHVFLEACAYIVLIKVHYLAPSPQRVPGEMERYLEWLEAKQNIDLFAKAGIAHQWFEAIHPFDDENGRIGRAIAELLLSRADNSQKRYYSLSSQILNWVPPKTHRACALTGEMNPPYALRPHSAS